MSPRLRASDTRLRVSAGASGTERCDRGPCRQVPRMSGIACRGFGPCSLAPQQAPLQQLRLRPFLPSLSSMAFPGRGPIGGVNWAAGCRRDACVCHETRKKTATYSGEVVARGGIEPPTRGFQSAVRMIYLTEFKDLSERTAARSHLRYHLHARDHTGHDETDFTGPSLDGGSTFVA